MGTLTHQAPLSYTWGQSILTLPVIVSLHDVFVFFPVCVCFYFVSLTFDVSHVSD